MCMSDPPKIESPPPLPPPPPPVDASKLSLVQRKSSDARKRKGRSLGRNAFNGSAGLPAGGLSITSAGAA